MVLERAVIILTLTAKTDGLEVGVVNLDTLGTDIRNVKVKRSASCHLRNRLFETAPQIAL